MIPSRSDSDKLISTREAMGLSAVFRAIQVIDTAIDQLSLDVYRGTTQISSPLIVRSPNVASTRTRFLNETAHSMAATGNAYWLIDRDDKGNATNLTPLNPLDVTIKATDWGTPLSYDYKGNSFKPDRIRHMKYQPIMGRPEGVGPIQAAQMELSGAHRVAEFAGTWFDDSGTPVGGYLSTDDVINGEDARAYRDAWTAATGDRKGVPVLGNGLEFKSILLSPKDALWIESQQFSITAVARMFGIPSPIMLAPLQGASDTYSNLEMELAMFARFTLMRYIREIEEAFSSLLPRGTEARFNLDALLRADTTTRYAAHAVAIQAGFLTVNEARAIEGLAPLDTPPAPATDPETETPNV